VIPRSPSLERVEATLVVFQISSDQAGALRVIPKIVVGPQIRFLNCLVRPDVLN
jgi:hypothetical protein